MPTTILNNRGQITIPKQIRKYLGLQTGDKLEFIIDKSNGCIQIIPITVEVHELKNLLPKSKKQISIQQMNKTQKMWIMRMNNIDSNT